MLVKFRKEQFEVLWELPNGLVVLLPIELNPFDCSIPEDGHPEHCGIHLAHFGGLGLVWDRLRFIYLCVVALCLNSLILRTFLRGICLGRSWGFSLCRVVLSYIIFLKQKSL